MESKTSGSESSIAEDQPKKEKHQVTFSPDRILDQSKPTDKAQTQVGGSIDGLAVSTADIKKSDMYMRPVSNVVLLPCRTQLIELNSTLARQ